MVKYLGSAALLNGFNNIRIKNVIVSNESGKISIMHDINTENGVNYGEHPVENMEQRTSKYMSKNIYGNGRFGYSVRHVTLNDLYYEEKAFTCPAFIKMDIECHEIDALIGGMQMLADCMPIL